MGAAVQVQVQNQSSDEGRDWHLLLYPPWPLGSMYLDFPVILYFSQSLSTTAIS